MIPQDSMENEGKIYDEEYFKNWLGAVRVMLGHQMSMELPAKRRQELTAYILLQKSVQTVAQALVNGMSDAQISELSDKPLEKLLEELACGMNGYLENSLSQLMTDWLEKRMRENAAKTAGPCPEHTPEETASQLVKVMADKASNGIFCPPELMLAINMESGKTCSSSSQQYFPQSAPCGFSPEPPSFFVLLGRANAIRFRVAGMAAIMLFKKICEREVSQIKEVGSN